MRPQRVKSLTDLRQLFYSLPSHHGDQRIADANLALLREAQRQLHAEPSVPYELTDSDRVFLKGIRVSA